MPLTMRRAALRAGLAGWGTLAAALTARKLGFWPHDAAADQAVGPPPLRDLSGLVVLGAPVKLPPLALGAVSADGVVATKPLDALLGPRGAVLNLWASWCGPCRREMPSFATLATRLRPVGVTVLPLSLDRGGADTALRFFRDNGVRGLSPLVDPTGSASAALGIDAIPVTLLIDRSGAAVARFDGSADWGSARSAARVLALLPPG